MFSSGVVGQMVSGTEPEWVNVDIHHQRDIPERYYRWLSDQGSLTSRLIDTCLPGRFRVQVVAQDWGQATLDEQQLLGQSVGDRAMIREVELCCDERPWVFARTVIPASSIAGRASELAHLGDKPLGALLFSDPDTRKELTQYTKLTGHHALFRAATAQLHQLPDVLWGRRSLYLYADKPILVNEIFLPGIPGIKPG